VADRPREKATSQCNSDSAFCICGSRLMRKKLQTLYYRNSDGIRQSWTILTKVNIRYGVAKPVHGVSTCSFGLSFGRRLPPLRKMVVIGSVGASRALIRGAFPTFPVLASTSTTSTHIRKCEWQVQGKSGRCGSLVRSGCSAVLQRELIGCALPSRPHWKRTISSAVGKRLSSRNAHFQHFP
jgi:hypothetical protein